MPFLRLRVLAVAAVAPLVLVAACGSTSEEPDPSATVTQTVTSSPSESASASTTPSSTPSATASGSAAAACATADLSAALGEPEGAMGSTYSPIVVTNTGSEPCVVNGFATVTYVGGEAGTDVGAPAERDTSVAAKPVTLAPGKTATAQLQEGEAGNYPAATCQKAKALGLKIVPPGDTEGLFVRHRRTVCGSTGVALLQVQAFTAG